MPIDPEPEQGEPEARPSPRDRWWFSPALQLVAGGAVIAFQFGPITDGTANWLNWVVSVAGLVVAAIGALSLLRGAAGNARAERPS